MNKNDAVFRRLKIVGWRQYSNIDIEFHPRITIITGANGAGKSTILNILSSHLGAFRPFLSVPTKSGGSTNFFSGIYKIPSKVWDWLKPKEGQWHHFGQLEYTNDVNSALYIPDDAGQQYNLRIDNQQTVYGFHMPSHRLMPNYQQVPNISLSGIKPHESFTMLNHENYVRYMGGSSGNSILFQLKQILACWAAIGEGNSIIEPDQDQLTAYRGFIEILKQVLPPEIGFKGLKIQPPDILLETSTGTFLIDAASGGLITIIEIAALIYACSLRTEVKGKSFVVTFDEPENHLHPALQRSLIPTLVKAFPNVQFIIATHSPFMVSSLKDSKVYVLRYTDTEVKDTIGYLVGQKSKRVESVALDHVNRAGSANEILRDALGVPITLPEWVDSELKILVSKYRQQPISLQMIEALKNDIKQAGLEDLFSEALARVGEQR